MIFVFDDENESGQLPAGDSDGDLADLEEIEVGEETGEEVEEDESSAGSDEEPGSDQPVSVSVDFPDDYLDTTTFESGVQAILDAVSVEEEESIVLYAADGDSGYVFPATAVYVLYDGGSQQVLFPSSYADDLYLADGYLCNTGSSVTVGMDLSGSASVSNYIISEVTFPTYNSATYWQYFSVYGAPYRIVDRYRSGSNTYSSYTRTTSAVLDFSDAELSSWRGFSVSDFVYVGLLLVLAVVAIMGRFRRL